MKLKYIYIKNIIRKKNNSVQDQHNYLIVHKYEKNKDKKRQFSIKLAQLSKDINL